MEKIIASRQPWSVEAEAGLIISVGDDLQIIKSMVEQNRAELWFFEGGSVEVYAVVRRDQKELVLMCVEGKGARQVIPMIEQAARRAGCTSVRAHITRLGLARMFPDWGLKEYVYEKEL